MEKPYTKAADGYDHGVAPAASAGWCSGSTASLGR